uniref:Uncharacterized protein n=1 Tax=Sphaerodactylus townsendi TaxID=933632 RepID=A0ACB8FU99_9SAUR
MTFSDDLESRDIFMLKAIMMLFCFTAYMLPFLNLIPVSVLQAEVNETLHLSKLAWKTALNEEVIKKFKYGKEVAKYGSHTMVTKDNKDDDKR